MSQSFNTADHYRALNEEPADHSGERRYVHVIGSKVFVDDRPAADGWEHHVVGIVGQEMWVAVDVPHDAEDPSYGAALDLYSYFGRSSPAEWLAAGRAVRRAIGRVLVGNAAADQDIIAAATTNETSVAEVTNLADVERH